MSYVTDYPAAAPDIAAAHYLQKLSLETDCADVNAAIQSGETDFVILHVVGTEQTFPRRHIPGAIHLPHRFITADRMAEWPLDTLFVVYCAGPHCNGADRAALKLARLGRPVKVMPGGITGWEDEKLAFA
ncbi:rhodanese-like domain-containing protein [Cedecea davisae]|uniref:rhodanese-like domain-containing protein n=1 Tax=Cedecea davisae TaxID=158484 RepID=UPI00242D628F|nr:rhodanese-like domain-containing protein [Cedecea davisae]